MQHIKICQKLKAARIVCINVEPRREVFVAVSALTMQILVSAGDTPVNRTHFKNDNSHDLREKNYVYELVGGTDDRQTRLNI